MTKNSYQMLFTLLYSNTIMISNSKPSIKLNFGKYHWKTVSEVAQFDEKNYELVSKANLVTANDPCYHDTL